MCGIYGFLSYLRKTGQKEIINLILQGLNNLLYRGHDSIGISFDDLVDNDKRIIVARTTGSIPEMRSLLHNFLDSPNPPTFINHIALGHTRWATHGPPNYQNGHPHVSSAAMEFVVVHNGSVDNYTSFRRLLEDEGFLRIPKIRKLSTLSGEGQPRDEHSGCIQFFSESKTRPSQPPLELLSDTDTELIAKYFLYAHNKNPSISFPGIMSNLIRIIIGSAAMIVKSRLYKGECVCCKLESPLVIGFKYSGEFERKIPVHQVNGFEHSELTTNIIDGDFGLDKDDEWIPVSNEIFISSDAQSMSLQTKDVMYLHDYDIIYFTPKGFKIFNLNHDSQPYREICHVENKNKESFIQQQYGTYCLSEIHQQPACIQSIINRFVNFETNTVHIPGLDPYIERIKSARRLILIGSGSSYNAALALRHFMEELLPQFIDIEFSCEFNERLIRDNDNVFIFISQSGETADTLHAVNRIRETQALCIGITNTRGSMLTRLVDYSIYQDLGDERAVPATKTFTGALMCILLLTLEISENKQRVSAVLEALKTAPAAMEESLGLEEQMIKISHDIAQQQQVLICGRGANYSVAREASIKLKTLCYMHAESFHEGELKHGPIALVEDGEKIIFLATISSLGRVEDYRSTLGQIAARGGFPIVMTDHENAPLLDFFADEIILLPKVIDCLQPIINVIPLQLLSYYVSKQKGVNPDWPRNLAKCATIN